MKFGLAFANAGPFANPDLAVETAQLAEGLGFESLWTVEHVVVPDGYGSQYPYSSSGKMPGADSTDIADPLIWLSWVGAATKSIRLGTGVIILPQRNPLYLAKEVATLDRLSGGRVELGVGVGWLQEEFDALGVSFEDRGRRTDDYIDALRCLWADGPASFDSTSYSFESLHSNPKPSGGSVPIVVGGHSPVAARRAGRLGDGFFPASLKDSALVEQMRQAAVESGRNPDEIEITSGAGIDRDAIKRLEDLGVARAVIPPLGFDIESLKVTLGSFSENVIAAF